MGEVLAWFNLNNRRERVVISGATSDWTFIRWRVLQGSILGHLLFLVYINSIITDMILTYAYLPMTQAFTLLLMILFLLQSVSIPTFKQYHDGQPHSFNPSKTEALLVSRRLFRNRHPPIYKQNQLITEVDTHKHIDIHFSSTIISDILPKRHGQGSIL